MPTITYDFVPGQAVYVVDSGAVKSGTVIDVRAVVTTTATTVTYWVNIAGTPTAFTSGVYADCRLAAGYQDVVFTDTLVATDTAVPSALSGETLRATVLVDGGSPGILAPLALVIDSSPLQTFQDVLDDINTSLAGFAVATLYQNNIRITSLTTGASSSVAITDVSVGSPVAPYFASLNTFTGLAVPVAGTDAGALDALGDTLC